ncbi:MAG: sugar phosphate isomerase/epimerase [Alphaproteobacteria bacterium]|uniref:Sugar phosphate isomerase/epimerase n=1 Tax=Candidatus Nitrobium versatile TaxID=2884831 RepID=A0A953LXP0_9BACT|nr:sugar phosphate isomerase/epimerase [Candidatus Nitrobium versatile]
MQPHVHVPYDRIGEHLSFILDNRLNLEIYFNAASLDAMDLSSLKRLKETLSYGPSLSFHAPFMDLCPAALDTRIRKVTLERFHQVLAIAEILSPGSIVFHSGYEKWKYAFNVSLWLEKSLETWVPFNEKARERGVKIAIENIFEDEPSNLRMLMEAMSSGNFGICFDAGHCNLFSALPPTAWIDELKPYIIELHLHDNDKTADQHLPPGEGSIDFPALFSAMRDSDCIYTIEAHTRERVMKSLERLKGYLDQSFITAREPDNVSSGSPGR